MQRAPNPILSERDNLGRVQGNGEQKFLNALGKEHPANKNADQEDRFGCTVRPAYVRVECHWIDISKVLEEFSFRLRLGLRVNTRTGWLRLSRFRTESPSCVALRSIGAGEFALPCQFLDALLRVLRARQRREESDNVIDLSLAEGKWLHIFIEIGIVY